MGSYARNSHWIIGRIGVAICWATVWMAGCGHDTHDTSAWTTKDAWYTPGPTMEPSAPALPKEKIYPVVDGQVAAATSLLMSASVVPVTAAQGSVFSGKTLTSSHLYVVRGISLNEATGAFEVFLLPADDIVVFHGSLGHSAVPMKRHPVVVELEHSPRQVYVECSMAE